MYFNSKGIKADPAQNIEIVCLQKRSKLSGGHISRQNKQSAANKLTREMFSQIRQLS